VNIIFHRCDSNNCVNIKRKYSLIIKRRPSDLSFDEKFTELREKKGVKAKAMGNHEK
jgi:hypothetical protein